MGAGKTPLAAPENSPCLTQKTGLAASPAETAQAWVRENEASSTIKQVAAAALICGQKVAKTASALGVDRRTIQRWRKLDPEFHLAMVQTKQEVILSSRQYLLALAEEAVEVVETKLGEEQSAQVALSLLRGFGVLSPLNLEEKLMEDAKSEEKQEANEFRAQSATFGEPNESPLRTMERMNFLPHCQSCPGSRSWRWRHSMRANRSQRSPPSRRLPRPRYAVGYAGRVPFSRPLRPCSSIEFVT